MKQEGLKEYFLKHDPVERCVIVVGALLSLYVIFINSGFVVFDLWKLETVALLGVFLIAYLPLSFRKDEDGHFSFRPVFCALMLMGVVPLIYLLTQIDRLNIFYGSKWTTYDIAMGTVFIVSMIALTKRYYGWAMPTIALLFIAYILFGDYLPQQWFGHKGFSFSRTVSYMFGPAAIFGEVMSVFVNVVFIYLLFGSFLEHSGTTEFMIDFSCAFAGTWRGGPAKIAVISSALMGTISGNAVANVATTGAVTIPLMKKTGYPPYFAGAVEAVASTGGQFLPPIMGAGAFIMAELLSVSYSDVVIAATIPALLYFVTVFLTVDLEAVRLGLRGMSKDEVPDIKKVMREGIHLIVPVGVLVYLLLVTRMGVAKAGLYSTATIVLFSSFRKGTRMNIRKIVQALAETAKGSVGIAVIIATAGLIIGTVGMTGLGTRLSSVILAIAHDKVLLVALLTAIICLVLGMGLPTTASYIVAVSVASATMMRVGIKPLAAHMFVFYFACISTITPPVCAAAFTAASMAGAPMMKTGAYASMLGITGFVVPFIFIQSSELLMEGSVSDVLLAVVTAIIGLSAIAMGCEGVCYVGGIRWNQFQRILFLSSALWLLVPGWKTDLVGLVIIAVSTMSSESFRGFLFRKGGTG